MEFHAMSSTSSQGGDDVFTITNTARLESSQLAVSVQTARSSNAVPVIKDNLTT